MMNMLSPVFHLSRNPNYINIADGYHFMFRYKSSNKKADHVAGFRNGYYRIWKGPANK